MGISDSKNFLLVHVQKTAGSSIRRLLEPFAVQPPRTPWNKLRSRPRVDFVGRLEPLHEEFEKGRARLDIEGRLVPFNVSRHAAYQSDHNARTRERVRRHWAAEIDAFGYGFDGLRRDVALPR